MWKNVKLDFSFLCFFPPFFADAVYTERYMSTPAENSDAYKVENDEKHCTWSQKYMVKCHKIVCQINLFITNKRFGFQMHSCVFLCHLSFIRTLQWQAEQRISSQWIICWFMEQLMVCWNIWCTVLVLRPSQDVSPLCSWKHLTGWMSFHVLTT